MPRTPVMVTLLFQISVSRWRSTPADTTCSHFRLGARAMMFWGGTNPKITSAQASRASSFSFSELSPRNSATASAAPSLTFILGLTAPMRRSISSSAWGVDLSKDDVTTSTLSDSIRVVLLFYIFFLGMTAVNQICLADYLPGEVGSKVSHQIPHVLGCCRPFRRNEI